MSKTTQALAAACAGLLALCLTLTVGLATKPPAKVVTKTVTRTVVSKLPRTTQFDSYREYPPFGFGIRCTATSNRPGWVPGEPRSLTKRAIGWVVVTKCVTVKLPARATSTGRIGGHTIPKA